MTDASKTIKDLQDKLDAAEHNAKRNLREYVRVCDENDELRDLVRDMYKCISHIDEYDVFYFDGSNDGCGMRCVVNGEHCSCKAFVERMRELGIEVDQ